MKCSNHFGAKRQRLLKVNIVLAPKGAIQNFIKNIRYDTSHFCLALMLKLEIIRIKVVEEQASKVWHWLNFRHILSNMIEDDT